MDSRTVAADVVKGAIAGAVGTKATEYTASTLYRLESEQTRKREEEAREQPPYAVAAEKTADLLGLELDERQKKLLAKGFHWGLGIGAGVTYAMLRRRFPQASAGQGLAFGTAFFVAVDEGVNTAFGFTPAPQEFPWQAHARGLASHLAFGVVAETTLDVLDAVVSPGRDGGSARNT